MAAKVKEKTAAKASKKIPAAKSAGKKSGKGLVKKLSAKLAKRLKKLGTLQAEIGALQASIGGGGDPVSPLAPDSFPNLPPVPGLRLATTATGVKYTGRPDVMLAELSPGSVMAGTFTRSATRAAPVLWCEERLAALAARPARRRLAIVVNAGNANAFTGTNGEDAVGAVMEQAAAALGMAKGNIFMASTGVIGEPLPHKKITGKLETLVDGLSEASMPDAAKAIMTTDTYPKGASRAVTLGDVPVTISGFAKGSGMIAPDMATMLVFIFTDCAIAQPLLQSMVSKLTGSTFNAITVDSDTSTSDTLLVGATGKAEMPPIESRRDRRARMFEVALGEVMKDLALQVVRDGEGATKLIEVNVTGARSTKAAHRIGLAIANSPLVKTAVAGEDPNWGRVVMAVGKSGEAADRNKLAIRFGDLTVAENGWVSDKYDEAACAAYMKGDEIVLHVDVGIGRGSASVWTCDLTRRYIEINADYRS